MAGPPCAVTVVRASAHACPGKSMLSREFCARQPDVPTLMLQVHQQRECCTWVCLTSYSPVANSRENTRILLIATNKETRPRATPIKRFCSGMGKCHTPCRQTSTL